MLYYNPHSFLSIVFAVRGSVLPLCIPQALVFAGIGAFAAWLVDAGYLSHDVNQVSLLCGLVISLLFTFRLNFSFARYEDAIHVTSAIQGSCRRVTARICAYLPSEGRAGNDTADDQDEDVVETVHRVRRWLILVFLLCKARVRAESGPGSLDLAAFEHSGLLTAEELALMRGRVTSTPAEPSLTFPAAPAAPVCCPPASSQSRPATAAAGSAASELSSPLGSFPSKARVHLLCQLLWGELALLLRQGRLHAQQFAHLDGEIGLLAESFNKLDTLLSQLLPFSFANMTKTVLVVYMASFPFGVATELGWATPAISFAQALLFLSMDRVGAVMDTPFAHSEWFGIDLEKRCRRTDKETAALVGVWQARPCPHFNLFPDTMRSVLPKRYHEDNVRGGGGLSATSWHGTSRVHGRGNGRDTDPGPDLASAINSAASCGSRRPRLLARQPTNGAALRRAATEAASSVAGSTEPLLSPARSCAGGSSQL